MSVLRANGTFISKVDGKTICLCVDVAVKSLSNWEKSTRSSAPSTQSTQTKSLASLAVYQQSLSSTTAFCFSVCGDTGRQVEEALGYAVPRSPDRDVSPRLWLTT
jgi:hypothetical protein